MYLPCSGWHTRFWGSAVASCACSYRRRRGCADWALVVPASYIRIPAGIARWTKASFIRALSKVCFYKCFLPRNILLSHNLLMCLKPTPSLLMHNSALRLAWIMRRQTKKNSQVYNIILMYCHWLYIFFKVTFQVRLSWVAFRNSPFLQQSIDFCYVKSLCTTCP